MSTLAGSAPRTRARRRAGLALGLSVLAALAVLSVCVGARAIPVATTWQALSAFDPGNGDHLLVRHLRVPRTLVAILAGSALGAAGTIMQALTRNPLADPGLLGVNAGAALAIVSAIALLGVHDVTAQTLSGLIGAGLAGAGVYVLGGLRRGIDPVRVVLAGAALSAVLLSLAHVIVLNGGDEVFDRFRHWAVGSLQGRGYPVLAPTAPLVAAGLLLAMALARGLDAIALGNDLGGALGASPAIVWTLSALAIVMLAGAATAAAGPIGFIGLAAPHLARTVAGPDHRRMLPCAILAGAIALLAADSLGRVLARPEEIDAGIMAALIGGPFFVALARRRRIAPP